MQILDIKNSSRHEKKEPTARQNSDLLNLEKFNALPSPVTARLCGGSEYWITLLDVQTGCMHIDVCGKTDPSHFGDVVLLIDIDGNEHAPDDFYHEDKG
jgi:hypothetical protein